MIDFDFLDIDPDAIQSPVCYSWQSLQKQYHAKYPLNGDRLFNFVSNLVSHLDYGFYHLTRKKPLHRNCKHKYNDKGYKNNLPKSCIWYHFLHGHASKANLLYYTNSLSTFEDVKNKIDSEFPVRTRYTGFILLCDLDNHGDKYTQDVILRAERYLESIHPALANMYKEWSTNGKGRHGYPSFYVNRISPKDFFATDELNDQILAVNRMLKKLVDRFLDIPDSDIFDAFKSTFMRRDGKRIEYSGTLGKLFLSVSDSEVPDVLDKMNDRHYFPDFFHVVQTAYFNAFREEKPLEQPKSDPINEGEDCDIRNKIAVESNIRDINHDIESILSEPDSLSRNRKLVKHWHCLFPDESLNHLLDWVKANNYSRSKSNDDERILKRLFNYYQSHKPAKFSLNHAKMTVQKCLKSNDELKYKAGSKHYRLTLDKVSEALHLLTGMLLKKNDTYQKNSISAVYIRTQLQIDGYQWKHIKHLLEKWNLLNVSSHNYVPAKSSAGVSKKYQLLPSHPCYSLFLKLNTQSKSSVQPIEEAEDIWNKIVVKSIIRDHGFDNDLDIDTFTKKPEPVKTPIIHDYDNPDLTLDEPQPQPVNHNQAIVDVATTISSEPVADSILISTPILIPTPPNESKPQSAFMQAYYDNLKRERDKQSDN